MRPKPDRPRVFVNNGTEFRVLGAPRTPFRDVYHAFLRASWPVALAGIAGSYLLLNLVFALAYRGLGGISNWDGSLEGAFFFSVQTMGTIGYGGMVPTSLAANRLVVLESVVGLVVTAMATGMLFAKFGRTTVRLRFASHATIAPHDGVPTLMLRVGYQRSTALLDVHYRLGLARTEHSREGVMFYRLHELALVRSRSSSLRVAFTLLHHIDEKSPLFGYDHARFVADECELSVDASGIDETTLQPVHASHNYDEDHVRFGARPADLLDPQADGSIVVDLRRFDEVVPADRS